ncbi:hypothetical protein VPH35_131568 [Triticum aestivum]
MSRFCFSFTNTQTLCISTIKEEFLRQIMQGLANEKISLPTGLCIHRKEKMCQTKPFCFCCLVNSLSYLAMDVCETDCAKPASSSIEASRKYGLSPSHVIHQ